MNMRRPVRRLLQHSKLGRGGGLVQGAGSSIGKWVDLRAIFEQRLTGLVIRSAMKPRRGRCQG